VLKYLKDINLKIILLNHQNYYVGRSSIMSNATKNFDILAISLSVLHNYFGLIKLFLDLYLAKSLNTLAKSFFPCNIIINKDFGLYMLHKDEK